MALTLRVAAVVLAAASCLAATPVRRMEPVIGDAEHPLVSVVVASLTHPQLLPRLVDVAARQTWPNFELIIVDDSGGACVRMACMVNSCLVLLRCGASLLSIPRQGCARMF
jgi:hypothetical protein